VIGSILLVILGLIAVAAVLFLAYEVWQRAWGHSDLGQLVPVDLEAFENLTDPEEEQFLREQLSPREFRRLQRLRLRAARSYASALSRNAALLMRMGQIAYQSEDEEIAAAGWELMQRAIPLQFFCLFSQLRMGGSYVFPILLSPSNKLARQYMATSYMAANLPGRAAA
jgi:hypothetical protein